MPGRLTTQKYSRSTGRNSNPFFSRKKKIGERIPIWKMLASDLFAAVGTVVGVFFLIWYITIRSSFFYLSDVTVAHTTYIPHDQLIEAVNTYLDSHRFIVLPTRSYPYFSPSALRSAITKQFGTTFAIDSIEISTKLPNHLSVTVHERVPSIVWVATEAANNAHYLVDREGVVTEYVNGAESLPTNLPHITDENRTELTVGELATSKNYVAYILTVYDTFQKDTGLTVSEFIFPKVECQELQYVMQQIFEDEIEGSVSNEFKQQKLEIQTQFKNGELTIDQSLDALDAIKQQELHQGNQNVNSTLPTMRWQQVSVSVPCDYSMVSKELHVVTQDKNNTFRVYVDAGLDLHTQLYNFASSVASGTVHTDKLIYFDARYTDRAYFKEK
ncbi:MAG: hypothetical protein KIH62_000415 [Candidatus Kerfeldbacteria bacterium]|nr:hypothetical protein [Candidatus Kerfeldbacteria bacterium]